MADDALIESLRAANAIRFGEFELSHGGTSDYYIDKYQFETDPGCLASIAEKFAERIDEPVMAGVALGAVPLVAANSIVADLPYVIVRKETKEYGTGNRIEGDLPENGSVVVVEDVATTGQSALDAVSALRDAGATVSRVLLVVDREEGARERLAEADIELEALVTASEILAAGDAE